MSKTKVQQLNQFMKELTELCHKHSLYIEGNNMRIETGNLQIIAKDVFYDMDGHGYSFALSSIKEEDK